ncbi:glycosyltransferase 87 family protein [Microbacterium sp. GXF7504]
MTRRAVLWIAFALVHLGVAVLGWVWPNSPMGDVYLVYEKWSLAFLHGGFVDPGLYRLVDTREYVGFVGFDSAWVYPHLALVPMLATWAFAWALSYTPAWALLVTLLDAVAFAVLVGRGRSRGRATAAWFWLAFLALLGPVALYRIDAVTVPLAILGCLWLVRRPVVAGVLLAVATWMKVWPAAVLAAAVVAVRRRLRVVWGALAVCAVTVGVVLLAGGGAHLFGFIGDQTGRDLQVEAAVSTGYLWATMLGVPGAAVYYDEDLLTFEVAGPFADAIVSAMTPVLAVAVAAVAVVGGVKAWRGAAFARLFPALALALVGVLIVCNKVGSPQFMVWLVAPVVAGLVLDRRRWRAPAVLTLVVALSTQVIYPLTYYAMLAAAPVPVLVITLRNVLLIALTLWAVVRLCVVPAPGRRATASHRPHPTPAGGH